MPCACAEEICRSGSISKNHQLTNLNKCGKFHACIRKSTILALSRLANNMDQRRMILGSIIRLCMDIIRYSARIVIILITDYRYDDDTGLKIPSAGRCPVCVSLGLSNGFPKLLYAHHS